MNHGNQYASLKRHLMLLLYSARTCLRDGDIALARRYVGAYREVYATAPASTRRRWRCGR